MPWVEMSEEEIAKRWLRKNNMCAVEFAIMEKVSTDVSTSHLMVLNAHEMTYRASPELRSLLGLPELAARQAVQ